jgi:hypothetical protein
MNTLSYVAQATGNEPAGGAALGEAIGATLGATVATALVAWLISGHRSGRIAWVGRAGSWTARVGGLPAWAALPSLLLSGSLLVAVLGMYWDISLHIDNGRDPGPLANPAHYLILIGLYGVLLSGVLTAVFAPERPGRFGMRVSSGWWAPLGGVLIVACGAFALSGFPLDDMWHRLFGQDVTLWGPTHLMLIGGASLATLGSLALLSETGAVHGSAIRKALLLGAFLVALSTFQGEFDFGVPQFRQVLQPVLIMVAAGVGLTTARVYLGRGGALLAVLGFLVIRGLVTLMVGVVWGQTLPHFPLYLVEALCVELAFLRPGSRSTVASGAIAGVLIGTVGLAAEWGWTHVWMPIPWTSALLPEGAIAGFIAAVAAGTVGGFVGGALARPIGLELPPLGRGAHRAALAGLLAIVAVIGWGLPMASNGPQRASVRLTEAPSRDGRAVHAAIRITPSDGLQGANFANVTAWQGGGSVVDPLKRVGPGLYRTTKAIPVHGGWKAMIRVQTGNSLVSVPIYMPLDKAIPAPEVPARESFTRPFVRDVKILQREQKQGVPGFLKLLAYLVVGSITAALIALIAWALMRLEGSGQEIRPGRRRATRGKHLVASPHAESVATRSGGTKVV